MTSGYVGVLCVFFTGRSSTDFYPLSLHDALPIWRSKPRSASGAVPTSNPASSRTKASCCACVGLSSMTSTRDMGGLFLRSEEHTSELQSRQYLVCRLLLEKKKTKMTET